MPAFETSTTNTFDAELWHPPANIFNCIDHLTVCVKLPGAEADGVQITVADRSLIMRGTRRLSESRAPFPTQAPIQCLFEATFPLPVRVASEGVVTEYRIGMFWIRIPLDRR